MMKKVVIYLLIIVCSSMAEATSSNSIQDMINQAVESVQYQRHAQVSKMKLPMALRVEEESKYPGLKQSLAYVQQELAAYFLQKNSFDIKKAARYYYFSYQNFPSDTLVRFFTKDLSIKGSITLQAIQTKLKTLKEKE